LPCRDHGKYSTAAEANQPAGEETFLFFFAVHRAAFTRHIRSLNAEKTSAGFTGGGFFSI
jgi:hypothetical protein